MRTTLRLVVVAAMAAALSTALAPARADAATLQIAADFPPAAQNQTWSGTMWVTDEDWHPVGGTWTWTITAGALPQGLVLNSVSGQIGGVLVAAGRSDFTVQASDLTGMSVSANLHIDVHEPWPNPAPPGTYDPVTIANLVVWVAKCALTPGMLQSTLSTLLYGTPPSVSCHG